MFPRQNRLGVVTAGVLFAGTAFFGMAGDVHALSNISTRANVGVGDNALIAGFIVTGRQPKKVIIRAIGPSLPFAGHLENPTLELRDSSGALLYSNDDWVNSPNKQAIIDSTIPPTNDLESAIVATLPANGSSYTAVVRGANGGTGIGVVEVYDLDPTVDSKLANISTRAMVQPGDDNVMIAGTIMVGAAPQKVLIRAIGPSLSMPHKLGDPTLELRDANGGLLGANDNWSTSANGKDLVDNTMAPADPLESAIMMILPSGNSAYTAIVRGASSSDAAVTTSNTKRIQAGSGKGVEVQEIQIPPVTGGSYQLVFTLPSQITSGQPGDKAGLQGRVTIPSTAATTADIATAILASPGFYKSDQNGNLAGGPAGFHDLFDSGGGLYITGNEGSRREPIVTGTVNDFTIQFGSDTNGVVGNANTWVRQLPLVGVDDNNLTYANTGIAVVEIYALQ